MSKQDLAREMVKELGKALTIPDLELNEQNYCALLFDGDILLNMEYDEIGEQMMLYVFLGQIPEAGAEELLRELLSANFFWHRTNGATLSLENDTQGIVLTYAHLLAELDAGRFHRICENFVQTAEDQKKNLDAWLAGLESSPETQGTDQDRFVPGEGMMRV